MPDAFSGIGQFFSSPSAAPIISGSTLGLGELGNLLAGRQQSQEANALKAQEANIANLPALVAKADLPINNALTQSVTNQVQGQLAERGLAQSPSVFAATESQALAPFAQQNYQVALQQVLAQLGLPVEYAAAIQKFLPQQQNMTPAMMAFLKALASSQSTTGPNAGLSGLITPTGVNPQTSGSYDFGDFTPPQADLAQLIPAEGLG